MLISPRLYWIYLLAGGLFIIAVILFFIMKKLKRTRRKVGGKSMRRKGVRRRYQPLGNVAGFAKKQSREFERLLEKQAENEIGRAMYKSKKEIERLKKEFSKKARKRIFRHLRRVGR